MPPSPCILGGAASGGGTGPSAPYPIFCWDEVLQWPQHQWTGQVRGTVEKYQLPFFPSPLLYPTFLYTVTLNNITVVFSLLSLSKSNFFPTYRPGKGGHFRFLQWYLFICASQTLTNFLEQEVPGPIKAWCSSVFINCNSSYSEIVSENLFCNYSAGYRGIYCHAGLL